MTNAVETTVHTECAGGFEGKRWDGEMVGAGCTACLHALAAHEVLSRGKPGACAICKLLVEVGHSLEKMIVREERGRVHDYRWYRRLASLARGWVRP